MGHIRSLKFTNLIDKAHQSVSDVLACILVMDFDNTPTEANVTVVDYNSDTDCLKIRITLYGESRSIIVNKIFYIIINSPYMLTNLRKELNSWSISSDTKYMKEFITDWMSKNGIEGYDIIDIFSEYGSMLVNFGEDRLILRLPIGMKTFEYEVLLKAYFFNLLKEMEDENGD